MSNPEPSFTGGASGSSSGFRLVKTAAAAKVIPTKKINSLSIAIAITVGVLSERQTGTDIPIWWPRQRARSKRESELSTFFRNLTALAIMVTLGAASASAEIAVEVYKFTGQCTDCTGTGTGTLILLADYVLGTPLSDDDLYSFNYSSNLIPDLSIHNDPNETISGILPVGLGPANITISDGTGSSFSSSSDGAWSALIPSADVGTNGIWSTASATPTPEPSALPMIGIFLAGVIFIRRWRIKAS